MATPHVLLRPLRCDFHSLILITGGEATHVVDFVEHRLAPGSVLWIKPGQVQQYGADEILGDLVIFQPDFLIPATRAATIANYPQGLTVAHDTKAGGSIDYSRRALHDAYGGVAQQHGDATPEDAELLRYLLGVLILRLDSATPSSELTDPDGLDSRFRILLERDFRWAHDAEHYAKRLGYSLRTLNRATQRTAGESPKQAVSRRLVLEARRLLAHTDRPVAMIAYELGFSDASNFATFFRRQTDETPSAFRVRAGQSSGREAD
ncbi:MAG TPA: helix-turn-helix transcriptional regulator [Solirubrobacterales bacterium]